MSHYGYIDNSCKLSQGEEVSIISMLPAKKWKGQSGAVMRPKSHNTVPSCKRNYSPLWYDYNVIKTIIRLIMSYFQVPIGHRSFKPFSLFQMSLIKDSSIASLEGYPPYRNFDYCIGTHAWPKSPMFSIPPVLWEVIFMCMPFCLLFPASWATNLHI